nr:MAG TPA: hypothetical protein [Caudoviricetes sp.]
MALIKWYYDSVSKRLIDSYIFFTKGHHALYGDERFYNLFNFKMVSSPSFLYLGSIPSIALMTTTK